MVFGLGIANGLFATDPNLDNKELDLDTVVYIEEELHPVLGFNTSDFLPEGFDPYEVYFNVNGIDYIESEPNIKVRTKRYLPENFDAYAFPKDAASFNYIDENDDISLNFDTKANLPEGFDPYIRIK
tara:strand:+ start:7025 stop:7405 length:381 start_codon:yes stop_codon:yes gene_type:complete